MKFSEIPYTRPDMGALKTQLNEKIALINESTDIEQLANAIEDINKLRSDFDTLMTLAHINYSLDTANESFQAEQDFFDENMPVFEGMNSDFYKALLKSPLKNELEKKYGSQLFSIAEMAVKTFAPEIIEDLQKENQLGSKYTKLKSSAKIPFDGKELNLSELAPYLNSPDREIRKSAQKAKYAFYNEHADEFDDIYDQLVKVRTTIAKKLGYENFVEVGYMRMERSDYNAQMVAQYRDQVKDHIVPISTRLKERQAKRLGLDKLIYYDEPLEFKTGNACPKGSPEWIVDNAKKMYSELSAETKEFFHFMLDNEMMDLVARKGKAGGGYCTFINAYKSPYIFSNFNGTAHDITVLTHEAGHAFQAYSSKDFDVPEYHFPTSEAAEIHSMSMEFLTWPWMELFFEQDTEKFKYSHLSGAIQFLPYGVTVDEFQHWVYENPEASPAERKAQWRAIEKKYLPHRNYEENEFLEKGGFWQQQAHIYEMPFYYIDYTLAQTCAFQFWKKANEDRKKAMEDYIRLCKAGGSKSFLQLVDVAQLISPFNGGCLESVAGEINNWLEAVDDSNL